MLTTMTNFRSPVEDAAVDRLVQTDVGVGEEARYGEDHDQIWEWWGAPHDRVVAVVHGGYFRPTIDRTHARPMAAALARAGFRVALLEYRRRPGDPDASLDDLRRFGTRLRELGTEPTAWIGHSAGGTLVMTHGLTTDFPGVPPRILALAPVADLSRAARERLGDGAVVDWMAGLPEDTAAYHRVDPSLLLAQGHTIPRLTILHGADDGTVPAQHSRDLAVPATILPGVHHFDLVDPESPHFAATLAALPAEPG